MVRATNRISSRSTSTSSIIRRQTSGPSTTGRTENDDDDQRFPTAIAAVCTGRGDAKGTIGVCCYDFSSTTLILSEFSDFLSYSRLLSKLETLTPEEVLLPASNNSITERVRLSEAISAHHNQMRIVHIHRKYYCPERGREHLQKLMENDRGQFLLHRLDEKYYCMSACAALFRYLEHQYEMFFFEKSVHIQIQNSEKCAFFDLASARYLGILVDFASSNQCGLAPGFQSLYSILQATKTKMGGRTLRANLMEPLIDVNSIQYRQDAVENFIDDEKLMFQVQTILLHFTDVERIILACIQENPSRSVAAAEKRITMVNQLRRLLDVLPTLQQALDQATSELLRNLRLILTDGRFQVMLDILNSQINTEQTVSSNGFLGAKIRRIFAIRSGFDERLDSLRADVIVLIDDVESLEKEFAERFSMPVRYNLTNARGFSLEIMGEFKGVLPPNVISVAKKQKSTFITTLQLAHLSDRFELLYNDICLLTDQIILILLGKIRSNFGSMYRLVEAVSIIDMLQSFAEVSKARDYVRPMFGANTKIVKARHPVIDLFGQQKPVANDIELCPEMNVILVTGPNMSGKSTYLRQIALLQILAQIGCFVPAEQARFRVVHEIFSKIRQHDNLFAGQSTFSSEINHIAFILNSMTANSMVILDEMCSSTSTNEGLALATSITETLCRSQALVVISTHFQQLTSVGYIYRNVANYHFDVVYNEKLGGDAESESTNRSRRLHPQTIMAQLKEQNNIIYSYTLRPGICKDLHYGITLASQIEDLQTVVELAKCVAKYYIRRKESILNQLSTIPNLLMKRVIIMKGYCDLIYDVSNNVIQFIEQQRVYLENFQKRMHQYWSTASSTATSSSRDGSEDSLMDSPSSPTVESRSQLPD